MLYPLKFKPIYKEKIWGGQKIRTILHKDFGDLDNCGESWELSGVEGDISMVDNGPLKGKLLTELIKEFKGDLVGKSVYQQFNNQFPLLIKFIDANADLSIQVHPGDELAQARHDSLGKTEMWYVFNADRGSKIISGFNRPLTKDSFLQKFNSGNIEEVLNQEQVAEGDSFFIPAGRVHTIGQGLLLAEIQQTSDVTYRIYDFDRKDKEGKKRELHVEQALDAIDYSFYDKYKTHYEDVLNSPVQLAECKYFTTTKLRATKSIKLDLSHDSFTIFMCVGGNAQLQWDNDSMKIHLGETILFPATMNSCTIVPDDSVSILETFVPQ